MKQRFQEYAAHTLKGLAMGAANVVPGVSGGTIALITGIFERLIHAIKSFNLQALALILRGRWRDAAIHLDLSFLFSLFLGVGIAIVSLARLFEYIFDHYPTHIWAFFFGLVLASVFFVVKQVSVFRPASVLAFVLGTAIAVTLSVLTPGTENDALWYVALCGVVAACSMIVPGLSGSFVLILLGNYRLIMIDAINNFRVDILLPTVIGAGVGILGFSHLLSWVLRRFRDQTIALLSGFILGSLGVLWPWKHPLIQTFGDKTEVVGYRWVLPSVNPELFAALALILAGAATIGLMEYLVNRQRRTP